MRIAFYAPLKSPNHAVPSGDRKVARQFVDALRRAGHDVELASGFRSFDGAGDVVRQARLRDIGGRLAQRLIRRNRTNPPDLWFTYHLYHKAPDWLGPAVSRVFGIPYLVAEASFAPKRAGGPWAAGHAAVAQALGAAHHVVCVNPADVDCLRPLLADPVRLSILRPFLDIEACRSVAGDRDARRAALAQHYGLDPAQPWIATVAMMRPGDKLASYRVLAEAMGLVADRDWSLLVAGDGPARPEIEALPGFAGRARFLGALDAAAVAQLNAAADIAAWPAVNEAYGVALLEAQATGLPAIAGDRPGVACILRHGRTGLLTPEGDARAFASALAELLDSPVLRAEMREEALRVSAAEHDIGAAATRLHAILDRVTTSASAGTCPA